MCQLQVRVPTHPAPERTVIGVQPFVTPQVGGPYVCPPAGLAHEWTLARVLESMLAERYGLLISLATVGAGEEPHVVDRADVGVVVLDVPETAVTSWAVVDL